MKKIFTLIAMAVMALGVNAETLIDFAQSKTIGIAVSGSTEVTTVKIHINKDAIDCIKFANSYTTENALNDNYAKLEIEGGFKAGDVITIAGAFNNADETKKAAIDIFTVEGTTPTVLFTTQQFINGRTAEGEPVAETFTLAADADLLYLGRNGNTATNVTLLTVTRGATAIENVKIQTADGVMYNLAGQKVGNDFKGIVIKDGKKMLQK